MSNRDVAGRAALCQTARLQSLSLLIALLFIAGPAAFGGQRHSDVDVVVDGNARPKFVHRGTTYVEALRGRDYSLRITNPTGDRVAVALSVDGLNTIDAKHTEAWRAAKWILGPYETIEIAGWQVSDSAARRFVFTGERDSYGAALGQAENLGVIEAVFFANGGSRSRAISPPTHGRNRPGVTPQSQPRPPRRPPPRRVALTAHSPTNTPRQEWAVAHGMTSGASRSISSPTRSPRSEFATSFAPSS